MRCMECQLEWGGNTNPTHQTSANMKTYVQNTAQYYKETFTIPEILRWCHLVLKAMAYKTFVTNK